MNDKHDDGYDPTDLSAVRMAEKLAPLRNLGRSAWANSEKGLGPRVAPSNTITYSAAVEGLRRVIARMNEVNSMSEVVRDSLTRERPKDDLVNPVDDDKPMVVFDNIAQLTIILSREIERTEKNLALALAVLK